MAEMIPKQFPDDQSSEAEQDIFDLLKDDPNTKDWIVLHSMDLASRGVGKPYGEIDFVIIIPKEGIICLEVKGGGISYDEDGKWWTTNRQGESNPLRKSPFKQAKESTLALLESVRNYFGNSPEAECPIGRMVGFPDVKCPPVTPEFERWEVIDFGDLRHMSSSIKKAARRWRHKLRKTAPTPSQARNIRNFLRPDFDRVLKKNIWIKESEDELLRLTEDQYKVLKMLEKVPHCLIEGAAGTGKTMLAVESSLRASQDGKKVLFICYNKLLSQWLGEQTEEHANITAGTFHGVLKNLIERSTYKKEFHGKKPESQNDGKLYDKIYVEYAQLALDKEELGSQFDFLVMDEAQDLIFRKGVLHVLNAALHGGLYDGQWLIFGDFSRQSIYRNNTNQDAFTRLKSYGQGLDITGPLKLPVNCRNTKQIAEKTYVLSKFDGPPSMPEKGNGLPVEYLYWEGYDHLAELLGKKINDLLQQDILLEDIVILFPARMMDEAKVPGFSLENVSQNLYGRRKKKSVKISTIHSFKGLESAVVIVVVGMQEMFGDDSQSLLYVSMSRAKSLLVMMMDKRGKKSIQTSCRNGLLN